MSTLISLDIFPQLLDLTKEIYFPFINDVEEIEDCDFALIEGCVSRNSEINILKEVRQHANKVFAFGSCAAFGGILSLSKKKDAHPISNYIEIDGIIPGCPPPSKMLGNILIQLLEHKEFSLPEKNMCAACPLRDSLQLDSEIKINKLFPNPEKIEYLDDNAECFLKQGILCLGPIIREGCEHRCIEQGIPCEGCMGPVSKDFTSNVVNFLSLVKLSPKIADYDAIFYRFSKPHLRRD
ncbi:MAG: hypothetical protein ACTSPW_02835 [Promethearchaeota archaeon]